MNIEKHATVTENSAGSPDFREEPAQDPAETEEESGGEPLRDFDDSRNEPGEVA